MKISLYHVLELENGDIIEINLYASHNNIHLCFLI